MNEKNSNTIKSNSVDCNEIISNVNNNAIKSNSVDCNEIISNVNNNAIKSNSVDCNEIISNVSNNNAINSNKHNNIQVNNNNLNTNLNKLNRKEFIKLCLKIPILAGISYALFGLTKSNKNNDKTNHKCINKVTFCRNCNVVYNCMHPTAVSFKKAMTTYHNVNIK